MALRVIPISEPRFLWGELREAEQPYTRSDTDSPADELAEFAGRACYQAWQRKNPKTQTNQGYLANILSQGHESVLEHASFGFYVTGVSRSLTHELIRHRHLSYSELSQRYVDMEDVRFVVPPALRAIGTEKGFSEDDLEANFQDVNHDIREEYSLGYRDFTSAGVNGKKAREAARWILPNATETKIVVSGNMRAWRDMLKKRYHVAADAEIREFAAEVLRYLRDFAPNSFQDFPDKPFGSSDG